MSKVIFDGAGFKAERLAVMQFGGELITDKLRQWKDIDAVIETKQGINASVSVKDQLWSSERYKGIQIEVRLSNSRTGAAIDGCFLKCEADYYFWRVHTPEYGDTWAIVPTKKMKAFVRENKQSLKTWQTQPKTEAKNRSYGRKYDRACGYVITMEQLASFAYFKPVEVSIH